MARNAEAAHLGNFGNLGSRGEWKLDGEQVVVKLGRGEAFV